MSKSIIYSPRQTGNPILKVITDVPLTPGEKSMKVDFEVSATCGVLFLSMKYNGLHPEYIYRRIEKMGKSYELRLLLVIADMENPQDMLSSLTKMAIRRDLTIVVTWSLEEAATYLTTLKLKSKGSSDKNETLNIQKKVGDTYEEQLQEVLTKVPRVNKTDVLGLSNHFKSFQNIIKNTDRIEDLEGWGPTKSAKFKKVVREPFTVTEAVEQP